MATITEDYVSFETAKLLKEKGFNELCAWQYYTYWEGEKLKSYKNPILLSKMLNNSNVIDRDNVTAPTLQMAMKWLREVHNMYYEIQLLLGEKAEKYGGLQLNIYQLNNSGAYVWKDLIYADTYVELYENYIKYCLEHLI